MYHKRKGRFSILDANGAGEVPGEISINNNNNDILASIFLKPWVKETGDWLGCGINPIEP